MREVPIEILGAVLRLDPETGKLYWRERDIDMFATAKRPTNACAVWNGKYAGREALASPFDARGYLHGSILNRAFLAHRVVFALSHGRWPIGDVDHIDGDPSNNRPENLREATRLENNRNMRGKRISSSQYKGVSWRPDIQKWTASCKGDFGGKYLGVFLSEIEAARAYDAFARVEHGEFARLNFPHGEPA